MLPITKRTPHCESPSLFPSQKRVVSRSARLVSLKRTPRTTTTVKGGASLAQLVGCQTLDCKVAG